MSGPLILELQGLSAGYGEIQVLWGIDLAAHRGEITALIGSNGAGKTTLMRALSGLIPTADGNYFSGGRDLTGDSAAEILGHGIVHVPEGRRLFGAMSVEDNLLMGAYSRKARAAELKRDLDHVYATFPKLRERRNQAAGTLSGGEQQELNQAGMSILLVEQDVTIALDLCHHAFVMDMGRIVRSGSGAELLADPVVRDAYLGVLQE